ncbi:MAG: hypothetical protein NZ692_02215, partial [Candidatus Marinimicrobia bacterium]|nr:hypothetical protein [Candidatus Neomarinimicrobiota bacterium]
GSKSDYRQRKKIRNRLAWIEKRFETIEKKLEEQRIVAHDPACADDYKLLQKAMEAMNILEAEYLKLMEEQETLQ